MCVFLNTTQRVAGYRDPHVMKASAVDEAIRPVGFWLLEEVFRAHVGRSPSRAQLLPWRTQGCHEGRLFLYSGEATLFLAI